MESSDLNPGINYFEEKFPEENDIVIVIFIYSHNSWNFR